MNTYETYVSLETAKMLKEAGFDWKCKYAYIITPVGDMPTGEEGILTEYVKNVNLLVSAPSLAVAQRWLREVKDYNIIVEYDYDFVGYCKEYTPWYNEIINLYTETREYHNDIPNENFSTYEEAQEAGIKKILELILEKGE